MATERVRLRTAVLGVDYRHPVLVHRMAAELDVVSDGRLTLGLGAGWMTSDYEAAGLAYDPPAERVDRLEETIEVVVGLFRPGPFDFEGAHYRVRGLEGKPPPVQRPHPPLFIGGGRPRVLRLAGAKAQVVGINASLRAGELGAHAVADLAPERVAEKVRWAREGAERAGRDPGSLVVSINSWLVRVTDDDDAADAFLERMAGRFGITGAELDRSPPVLVGPLERIEAKLRANRERFGITHVQLDAGFHPADVAPLLPIVSALRGR
jgi:probable F420-dependent oxidoreductase